MALSSFTVTIITKSDSPFNVIPNAPIEIRERLANGSSGGLSLIFSDQAGLNPITQVGFTANSLGQATFYAAAADYNAVYDNNGTPVTIAVDVGVTGGILNERFDRLNPATLDIWQADTSAQAGDVVTTAEYSTGNGGGATGQVISGTGTANGFDKVAHGTLSLTWVMRDAENAAKEQFGVTTSESSPAYQAWLDRDRPDTSTAQNIPVTVPVLYPKIVGNGDEFPISISGTGGLAYTFTLGEFDDHAHRSVVDLRLKGTGAETLYLHDSGSYAEFERNTFEAGVNGLVIRGSFTCNSHKNHYKGCTNGLVLDDVTSYQETDIYARGNTTAAIRIQGSLSENITLRSGAIEGNRGSAIKVDVSVTDQFRLLIDDTYFELDGDTFGAADTPAFDIPELGAHTWTRMIGGKISYNVLADWISGDYNFGNNVIFDGTKVAGVITSKTITLRNGVFLADTTLNDDLEPMFCNDWDGGVQFSAGFGATRGYTFSCPVMGKATASSPVTNTTKTAHPYVTILGAGPSIAANSALDYGDGDWSEVTFSSAAGSFGTNSIFLGNTTDGTKTTRTYSFLVQAVTTTTIEFLESGAGTGSLSTHILTAGKTYKMVVIANKTTGGTQRLAIYPTGTDAPVVNFLALNQSIFDNTNVTEASAHISQVVRGIQ